MAVSFFVKRIDGYQHVRIRTSRKARHVCEVHLQLIHRCRRYIAVVASLGPILCHYEALDELLNLLPGDARVPDSCLSESVCNVPEASSRVFIDLFDNPPDDPLPFEVKRGKPFSFRRC